MYACMKRSWWSPFLKIAKDLRRGRRGEIRVIDGWVWSKYIICVYGNATVRLHIALMCTNERGREGFLQHRVWRTVSLPPREENEVPSPLGVGVGCGKVSHVPTAPEHEELMSVGGQCCPDCSAELTQASSEFQLCPPPPIWHTDPKVHVEMQGAQDS